jgi:zinc protease
MQSNLASRLIHNMVFSPAPIVGTFSLAPEKLSTLDLDTVRIWQQETFHRGNLSVAAAGPLPAARMTEVIEQMFGKLPSGPAVAKAASVAATTPAKLVLLHTPTVGKSVVSIAGRLPALRAEPEIEVFFATMALSDGESSRLNAAVRGDLRASYGMQAGVSNLTHEHRLLMFEGEIEGPKIKPALAAIRNAYENLRLNGLTQEEFEAIRGKILTYIRAARNQPDFIASSMLEAKLSGMPITKGLNLLDNISAMTRDHVNQRIARDFPAFDAMVKIVVTPDEKAVSADCVVKDPDAFQSCLK